MPEAAAMSCANQTAVQAPGKTKRIIKHIPVANHCLTITVSLSSETSISITIDLAGSVREVEKRF